MEYPSELKIYSSDRQAVGTSETPLLPQTCRGIKLQGRLKPEKPILSYHDFQHEITNNAKEFRPKSSENIRKQQSGKKATEEDELVKYMSNLPSFLERGENLKEKALNVGVLDWRSLEKWHYSNKQIPGESSRYWQSCSSTSRSFSTDGSSALSSKHDSRSPAHPRRRRPSLHYHLMASPIEGHSPSHDVKAFGGNFGNFQDLKPAKSNILSGQGKFIRTDQPSCNPVIKPKEYKRKDSGTKINQESGFIGNNRNYEAASCTNLKTKIQDGEIKKSAEKLRQANSNSIDHDVNAKRETAVLILPKDLPQKNNSRMSQSSDSTTSLGRKLAEASRRSFTERSKEIFHAELSSIPYSCPLPCEVDNEHSYLADTSSPIPWSAKVRISSSISQNYGEKQTILTPTNRINQPLKGLDVNINKSMDEKVRSSSPFRRFNIGLGKMSKSFSSKEGLDTQHMSSTYTLSKSGSQKIGVDMSNNDKLTATGRARSSPLRRLLDPLLKPKATSCHHLMEPLLGESISMDRTTKNFSKQLDSQAVDSGKPKLDTTVKAFLRVAIKNDQPLITFAVNNDSDILAATVKKLSVSRKGDYNVIYTFFTIQQVKKKNGRWINQGGRSKGKGPDYIPNVVAQMKVYDSEFSNLIGPPCMDHFSTREFVLFSVDLKQADHQTSDFQPNNELAAVVVKIPKSTNKTPIGDGCKSNNRNDLLGVGSKECGMGCYYSTGGHVQKLPFNGTRDFVTPTVILPSGVHSLPSKGGPSSLVERWKTGGLCDCGGWDLGCKLRILADQNHINNQLDSSKACPITDKIQLFCQDDVQVNQPFFSLAPFKDGIYSVEFNSSLSILQAFSICIAVLDSTKPCELSLPRDSIKEKTWEETRLIPSERIRTPNRIEVVPARYASYPPLSPVGRV
ncbi:hypothetical protein I3760_14G065300 [Carya illinoinensis]|uniref:DUF3527 domain protein n=1 Tax=Carya illinoinensis TaxID=32201 RepID=A0A8T1NFJ9_CARIL|nr:uncharacterized protein LOC122294790 [Carya illinoinensis]XP_042959688.1 uncharacterized protein LOC122294790 [Carya illinoinensis]XP_042959689.1 uncharacterized protein LOC122294790 [Carya illinoinensis]XP_042959690.1 uncharacterized protein LOC122294790 [Carya illinoinensis]KAG2670045.1 hypothetical protein I3760_14G065300 [Carya illinoinensis]KAG2670046.1 hypothetical protein I3760_14G065300 [Carya illinoinensis]KAG2670047.1 hypothetical protein I3760_14G065300 [Carya illinoinensis]KAG